jgi:hypothetical protein
MKLSFALPSISILVLASLVTDGHAESNTPTPTSGRIDSTALAQGSIDAVPSKPPRGISPSERAPGFVRSTLEGEMVVIAGNKVPSDILSTPRAVCFSQLSAPQFPLDLPQEFGDQRWNADLNSFVQFSLRSGNAIAALRRESLLVSGDSAKLEWANAWVSTPNGATRLVSKGVLPLLRIRSYPGGLQVFGASDGKFVQFVLARTGSDEVLDRIGPMAAETDGGQTVNSQRCNHLRIELPVERGEGHATTVLVPLGMDLRPEASESAPSKGNIPLDDAVRVRELSVHFSVSQLSRDSAPIMSVSAGWKSRDRNDRLIRRPHGIVNRSSLSLF